MKSIRILYSIRKEIGAPFRNFLSFILGNFFKYQNDVEFM